MTQMNADPMQIMNKQKLRLFLAMLCVALLPLPLPVVAQTVPRDPVTVDRTNKRLNESVKVPSGKTLTIETGGTLTLQSGSTLSPIFTEGDATAAIVRSTFGSTAAAPVFIVEATDPGFYGEILRAAYDGEGVFLVMSTGEALASSFWIRTDTDCGVRSAGSDTIALAAGGVDTVVASATQGVKLQKAITAGGTTGAQTINKPAGSVNLAASATSLVVTNSMVTTSSVILLTVGTNDVSNFTVRAVAASGSFTIHVVGTAPAAETRVNFLVIN